MRAKTPRSVGRFRRVSVNRGPDLELVIDGFCPGAGFEGQIWGKSQIFQQNPTDFACFKGGCTGCASHTLTGEAQFWGVLQIGLFGQFGLARKGIFAFFRDFWRIFLGFFRDFWPILGAYGTLLWRPLQFLRYDLAQQVCGFNRSDRAKLVARDQSS